MCNMCCFPGMLLLLSVLSDEQASLCILLITLNYLEHCVTEPASVGNNEPAKRQRRWNTETVKGPDSQSTTPRPATTPKDEQVALKRNFSRSDSSAIDDAPKERIGKLILFYLE